MRHVPLLLGLAACGNSSYYPRFEDEILDTGQLVLPPEPTLPCSTEGTGAPYSLTLINRLRQDVDLYFIDLSCTESLSVRVPGYQSVTVGGSDGTVWVVRTVSGAYIEHFTVPQNVPDWPETVP